MIITKVPGPRHRRLDRRGARADHRHRALRFDAGPADRRDRRRHAASASLIWAELDANATDPADAQPDHPPGA